jgi:hypothetical protein
MAAVELGATGTKEANSKSIATPFKSIERVKRERVIEIGAE